VKPVKTIRKPQKILEIDETVTMLVIKCGVWAVKIKDEGSKMSYRITRTPKKKSLQMTGV
jgi:hypothetical protein